MILYLELFLTFLKIGAFTFGGGYAMIPLIQDEVISHGWLGMNELYNFIAISESTPGPFAVNISTYVGAEMGGVFGSFCATLGVVLPSFIIILIVAKCYEMFKKNKIVAGCMVGLKATVVGLIASTIVSVLITVFFPEGFSFEHMISFGFLSSLVILALVLFLQKKKLHPILLIMVSAVLGIAAGYLGEFIGA